MNEIAQLEQQISEAALEYSDAIRLRVHDMDNAQLREKVSTLSAQLKDLKKMRTDLIKLAEHQANEERLARAKQRKSDQAAEILARGKRESRLDQALETLVLKYFELNPGSFCLNHITLEIMRIRQRHINTCKTTKTELIT